jgi:uncharacterized protein YcfJ
MKKTIVIAVGSILTAAAPAFAQSYPDYQSRDYRNDRYNSYNDRAERNGYARVLESRPLYDSSVAARDECWNPRANHFEEVRSENKTRVGKGAAIGAVAGGVIGHQIGDNGTAQTLGGALLGGLIGHQIEKRNDDDRQDDLDYSRCRTVGGSGDPNRIMGYDVRYEYNGREYVTRMDHDPGRTLRPGRDIAADGTPAYNSNLSAGESR